MIITCVMKVDGKIVTVRNFPDGLKMVAIDQLNSIPAEHGMQIIESVRDKKKLMAFHFRHNEKNYCTKVVEECLKVEETDCCDGNPKNISDNHWFVMEENGNGKNYNLHTLCAPRLYLSLPSKRTYTFTLTHYPQESVEVSPSNI